MRSALFALLMLASLVAAEDRPPNRLCLRGIEIEQRTRRDGLHGMTVHVVVETVGFGGQEVRAQVWLTGPEGEPLRAPRGTPARYRDSRGGVRVSGAGRVEGKGAGETRLRLFFPYRAITPPGRRERRIGVWASARCGGFRAMAVEAGYLPPLQPPTERFRMRIASIHVETGSDSLAVTVRADGGAIRKGRLEAGFRMRGRDGRAVRVRPDAPERFANERGFLDCRGNRDVPPGGTAAVPVRLEVPFDALDLEPDQDHDLALTVFARIGGWRAMQEQEVRFRIGDAGAREVLPPREPDEPQPEPELALELLLPAPGELAEPCRGGSGEYGMTSNLLRIEVSAVGLEPGVHRLEIDLGEAGRRYVWVRHAEGAPLVAVVPVPSGPFRARLSVAEASVAFEGRMAAHAWAPSEDELAEWRSALDDWRAREGGDPGFVVSTLSQIAEGHLLRGDYERAAAICRECLELRPTPEQCVELDRIRSMLFLLEGKLAELDSLYQSRVRAGGEAAPVLREWAERRALLDADPSRSRELWRRATRSAGNEGAPPRPIWYDAAGTQR